MPLIEVVANSTKTEKPGWTYVADTGYDRTKAPIQQPTSRKRNARIQDTTDAGLTARQSTALAKRVAELEKDNSRDLAVPVPGKRSKAKNPSTKKILESQRTFAHYLADEEAMAANETETAQAKSSRAAARKSSGMPPPPLAKVDTNAGETSNGPTSVAKPLKRNAQTLEETEARLMQIFVPAAPSERLMDALTSAPPLSWNEARARPSTSGKPQRHFCEICGYWGRVKCLQCGARVCGLTCKRAHDDGRCLKYGT